MRNDMGMALMTASTRLPRGAPIGISVALQGNRSGHQEGTTHTSATDPRRPPNVVSRPLQRDKKKGKSREAPAVPYEAGPDTVARRHGWTSAMQIEAPPPLPVLITPAKAPAAALYPRPCSCSQMH